MLVLLFLFKSLEMKRKIQLIWHDWKRCFYRFRMTKLNKWNLPNCNLITKYYKICTWRLKYEISHLKFVRFLNESNGASRNSTDIGNATRWPSNLLVMICIQTWKKSHHSGPFLSVSLFWKYKLSYRCFSSKLFSYRF